MAINLHSKYADQIQQKFVRESLIAGLLSTQYNWAGVKTVKVSTLQTVPMVDYTRTGSSRYGTPTEMGDVIQEMTLTQDKAFSLTIDKGNNADQSGIKEAGKALSLQISERAVPAMDKYVLNVLATKAGKIIANSTALSKTTVCDRISEGTQYLDDAEVPATYRTLLLSATAYKYLKHSDEFLKVPDLAKETLVKGQVGEYDNMKVVKIPSGRWPANVNFMIVYKNSGTAPVKLNDTKMHQDPPGISGNLLEGRQYYDCFVFGAKCDGIYVEVDTTSGKGAVLAAPTVAIVSHTATVTPASGATAVYTLDGSDPRYSASAVTYSTTVTTTAGQTITVYQYKTGAFNSVLATATDA